MNMKSVSKPILGRPLSNDY